MPAIYLIRPGETREERDGFLIGRFDADLDALGRWQARQVARHLARVKMTRILVSPLKRALSVAMELGERQGRWPKLVKSFDGVDLGEWECQRVEDLTSRDGLRFENWPIEPDFPCPGGESMRNVYRRAFSELAAIVSQCEPGETLAVIAPSIVLQCLCCGILDMDLKTAVHFSIDHGGVSLFQRVLPAGHYQLVRWNENHHLKIAKKTVMELESGS